MKFFQKNRTKQVFTFMLYLFAWPCLAEPVYLKCTVVNLDSIHEKEIFNVYANVKTGKITHKRKNGFVLLAKGIITKQSITYNVETKQEASITQIGVVIDRINLEVVYNVNIDHMRSSPDKNFYFEGKCEKA